MDLPFVAAFCGDPAVPSSLKPIGTVVRARVSLRYFVCIGDLGTNSYVGIQTNQPGDQQQGFIPYATLFRYDDPANPNLQRPSKGATNYGLIVINVLGTTANSSCRGSNATFDSLKIGGAITQACNGVPSPVRDEGGNKYVDVTFPGGQMQSFLLEPVPFEPPG